MSGSNTHTSGVPMEIERKYLIRCPGLDVLDALPDVRCIAMAQTYLMPEDDGFGRRVRRAVLDGRESFTYTRKKAVAFGECIELEDEITEDEYQTLLTQADLTRKTIHKVRYGFTYQSQYFELDVYSFSATLATLEIELDSIDTPVQLPPQLEILADVTGDAAYSNSALSKTLAFPCLP